MKTPQTSNVQRPTSNIQLINRRFHELAVKHALGTATAAELKKLDRYQALRRPKLLPAEVRREARERYKIEKLTHIVKEFFHGAQFRAPSSEIRVT